MKLKQFGAKLSKMSPAEIDFRIGQKCRQSLEQFRWRLNNHSDKPDLFVPNWIKGWKLEENPFPDNSIHFLGLTETPERLQDTYHQLFPQNLEKAIKDADEILNNQFHLLGLDVEFSGEINWNMNPQTGKVYPLNHPSRFNTADSQYFGDVKYVWELNRHQFFIELGKAYLLTHDERYVEKLWQLLESWCEQVPYKIGINHTSVLEHAVRIFSWIWAYYFTQFSSVWTPSRKEQLVKHLLLQGVIIEENLSYYYSPYNHLIGELAALSLLGTVYGQVPRMQKWRDHYWNEMEKQINKQFHTDGFTVEQASYYHHFTLGFYLTLAILRVQNNLPVSDFVWERLRNAVTFSMHLTRPDGLLPMIGDIDNARSVYFYRSDTQWELRFFLALGAVLYEDPEMKFVAGGNAEEVLWILGSTGIRNFNNLEANSPQKNSIGFFESGYFVLRDGWGENNSYCCFDCGEIAAGVYKDETPSAAHGHADILSFELCVRGHPLIIDPGFYTYFGPLEWHRYFRSTRGHNSIEVNERGQAIHEARLAWSKVSSPELIQWRDSEKFTFVGGKINRFADLEYNITHSRYILLAKDEYVLIMDYICGTTRTDAVTVDSFMHFVPGKLDYREAQLYFNEKLVALSAFPPNAKIDMAMGGEHPQQGWMATGYGYKQPAPVMRIRNYQPSPVCLAIVFPLNHPAMYFSNFFMERIEKNVVSFILEAEDKKQQIFLNPLREKFVIDENEIRETDSHCAVIKINEHNKNELMFINK